MFRATSSLRLYTVCVNKLHRIISCRLYWDGWVDVRMYVNLFRREGSDRVSSDQAACKRVASPCDTTFELLTYYSETTCLQLFHHNSDRQNRDGVYHTYPLYQKKQTCFQPRHPAQIFCNHCAGWSWINSRAVACYEYIGVIYMMMLLIRASGGKPSAHRTDNRFSLHGLDLSGDIDSWSVLSSIMVPGGNPIICMV